MSETITGQIVPIKSGYVDSDNPNVLYTNLELLKLKDGKSECYVIFDVTELSQIPPCATLKLGLYAHYDINTYTERTILSNIYKLSSPITDNTTYNNMPSKTLIAYIGDDKRNTYFVIDIPEYASAYNYGFAFDGYCYVRSEDGYIRSELSSTGRPYLEYTYTKSDIHVNITGASIDDNITLNWSLDNQLGGSVKAYQNGNLIKNLTITSENTVTFEPGSFVTTDYITVEVEVYKQGELYTSSTVITNITNTKPTITSLEPSNVQMLRTDIIPVTFTATNVTSWILDVKQNGVTKHSASGTNERVSNIQANVLSNGSVTITLTCKYVGNGYTTTTTKEVSFIAYGKPESPTLIISNVYNTPKPLLQWVLSSEQVAYRVVIHHGEDVIIDTSAYGNDSAYQVTDLLVNNNIYSISLYIKNQYDLWSDPVTASFEISFAELEPPVFTIYNDDDNAMNVLVIESPVSEDFYYHEVYRREKGTSKWLKIADNVNRVQTIKDNECKSNALYEYKVTAVSSLGAYTDSEIKECSCNFHNTHINVANSDQKVIL